MSDKAVLENCGTSESIFKCCKNQERFEKAIDNYLHTLKFVPDCYITLKMHDKGVNTYPSTLQLVPDQFKTQDKAADKSFLAFI